MTYEKGGRAAINCLRQEMLKDRHGPCNFVDNSAMNCVKIYEIHMPDGQAATAAMKQPDAKEEKTLREKIIRELPDGANWLQTPHLLLGERTPDQAILDGDLE